MANNRMKYILDGISSIKGKKTTQSTGTVKGSGANVSFRCSFLDSEFNPDLGFNVDKENNIEFKIPCDDNEVSKLGTLLEVIKKQQYQGKKIDLEVEGSLPSYGDYKTVYSVNLDISATDFIKKYEPLIK